MGFNSGFKGLKLRELEDPFSCGVQTVKEVCLTMVRNSSLLRHYLDYKTVPNHTNVRTSEGVWRLVHIRCRCSMLRRAV